MLQEMRMKFTNITAATKNLGIGGLCGLMISHLTITIEFTSKNPPNFRLIMQK